MFEEIAPSIFAVSHRLVDGKNAIAFGARGALAVDACNYADEGQAMADFIRSHGVEPNRLAFTHGHGDHILGSAAFGGADVYAHHLAAQTIDRHLPTLARRYFGGSVADAEAAITRPNVLFESQIRIDLGGKTARLFATPGHCPDAVCVYFEEDRVLCGGDTVVTGIVPAITDGNSRELEATLGALRLLDIDILIPGHGRVLCGAGVVREHLSWMIEYLSRVRAAVAAGTLDGSYERLVGDRLPEEPFGMRRRHGLVVSSIIAEQESETA